MVTEIDAPTLKAWLSDGSEIALIDVREAGQFGEAHPFFAIPLPYSRFELGLWQLVPNPAVRLVLCDDGDGVAERAARRAEELGYRNLHILAGGAPAWGRAGYTLYAGVNVPSKTFGELVEHRRHTPHISAAGAAGDARGGREHGDRRRPHLCRVQPDEHSGRHQLPERRAGAAHQGDRARPEDQDRGQLRRPHALDHRRADADRFRRAQSGRGAGERHARLVPGGAEARERRDPALSRSRSGHARPPAFRRAPARLPRSTAFPTSRRAPLTAGSPTRRGRPIFSTCAPRKKSPRTAFRASRTLPAASSSRRPISGWASRARGSCWSTMSSCARRWSPPGCASLAMRLACSPAASWPQARISGAGEARPIFPSCGRSRRARLARRSRTAPSRRSTCAPAWRSARATSPGPPGRSARASARRPRRQSRSCWLPTSPAWRRSRPSISARPDARTSACSPAASRPGARPGCRSRRRRTCRPTPECIDFLFFTARRHDNDPEAARQYLTWETGLLAQLDEQERGVFFSLEPKP